MFDKEAVGGDSSSDKFSEDEQDDHISHDDVAIVDGGLNNDNSSNTELIEVITDITIEGFPPIIPEHQYIIWEYLNDVFGITNPKAWQVMLIQSLVLD